jgi:hypothetical protein
MIIKWKGPAQHMDQGLVKPGDVIDAPDDVAKVWIRDGDAEEVKKPRAAKKADAEE